VGRMLKSGQLINFAFGKCMAIHRKLAKVSQNAQLFMKH
jgi:hypothetical protein